MHMVMVIAGGTVLLGVFLLFGHLWDIAPASSVTAAKVFIPFWLTVSVANLWVGVSKAGYTVAEELPILLGLPEPRNPHQRSATVPAEHAHISKIANSVTWNYAIIVAQSASRMSIVAGPPCHPFSNDCASLRASHCQSSNVLGLRRSRRRFRLCTASVSDWFGPPMRSASSIAVAHRPKSLSPYSGQTSPVRAEARSTLLYFT